MPTLQKTKTGACPRNSNLRCLLRIKAGALARAPRDWHTAMSVRIMLGMCLLRL